MKIDKKPELSPGKILYHLEVFMPESDISFCTTHLKAKLKKFLPFPRMDPVVSPQIPRPQEPLAALLALEGPLPGLRRLLVHPDVRRQTPSKSE